MGTIHQVGTDGRVTTPNMMITPEGGLAVRVYNGSGAPLLQGRVVKPDLNTDDGVLLTVISDPDPIGVVYADIPDTQWGWVVVSGVVDVYVDNAGATPRESWLGVSPTTAGQCTSSAVPPGLVLAHFTEVGHTVRSRTGAGLVRSIVHFN